jgi:glycosyltransferase involved in cell wall biosynthesis
VSRSTVDVFIPCYNYGRYLAECLHSVITQDDVAVRVVIIDDASTDNSAEVATELAAHDPRIDVIRHRSNQGHIRTYNEGIEWSRSEYFTLLSADDMLAPGSLRDAVSVLDRHAGVALLSGKTVSFSGKPPAAPDARPSGDARIVDGRSFIAEMFSAGHNLIPSPAGTIVRTAGQKAAGGYRPDLPHAGDMEMWLRIALHGDVAILPAIVGWYRQHDNNMSKGYYAAPITDLRQLWDTFDSFAKQYGADLVDCETLTAQAAAKLADVALAIARRRFDAAQLSDLDVYLDFAATICPNVTRTTAWRKLQLKRRMGYRLWAATLAIKTAVAGAGRPIGSNLLR